MVILQTESAHAEENGAREMSGGHDGGRPIKGILHKGHHLDHCLRIAVSDPNGGAWCIEFDDSALIEGPIPLKNDPWGRDVFILKRGGVVVETRTTTVEEFIQSGCIIRLEKPENLSDEAREGPGSETGEVGDPTTRTMIC